MKKLSSHAIVLITALLFSNSVFAQEKPQYDMGKMQMVLLSLAPDWKPKDSNHQEKIERKQRLYVTDLISSGKCALAGPTTSEGPVREVLVFKVESTEEIIKLTQSLPAVKEKMMTADVLAWYAARNVILTPPKHLSPTQYIFGLLVRGSKWTPEKTPESEKIQEGHLANITRLAEAGHLVLAGPFYDGGERRGVFIFKVGTIQEAQDLTDTDPAVKAGRLKIELYQWSIPDGILK